MRCDCIVIAVTYNTAVCAEQLGKWSRSVSGLGGSVCLGLVAAGRSASRLHLSVESRRLLRRERLGLSATRARDVKMQI